MAEQSEPPKPTSFGPAFNATGRDDTSTEILTPQMDPAVRARRGALIAALILVVGVMLVYSYLRNPINPNEMPHSDSIGNAKANADRDRKTD